MQFYKNEDQDDHTTKIRTKLNNFDKNSDKMNI